MMREIPKADPARALRERAERLRAKAKHIVRQYGSREGDDAWSWLLDTAELCELAADAMRRSDRLRAELENIASADPRQWHEETRDQFRQWAQSRARAALNHAAPAAEQEEG